MSSALQVGQLTRLTHLSLAGGMSDAVLQDLSSLAKCSHLVLGPRFGGTAAVLAEVQELQALTALQLSDVSADISTETVPGLSRLTAADRACSCMLRPALSLHCCQRRAHTTFGQFGGHGA